MGQKNVFNKIMVSEFLKFIVFFIIFKIEERMFFDYYVEFEIVCISINILKLNYWDMQIYQYQYNINNYCI